MWFRLGKSSDHSSHGRWLAIGAAARSGEVGLRTSGHEVTVLRCLGAVRRQIHGVLVLLWALLLAGSILGVVLLQECKYMGSTDIVGSACWKPVLRGPPATKCPAQHLLEKRP